MTHILEQSQCILDEVEGFVPLRTSRDSSGRHPSDTVLRWDAAAETKVRYLLKHLEAFKLTLNVMTQAFYAVRMILWSRLAYLLRSGRHMANSGPNLGSNELSSRGKRR